MIPIMRQHAVTWIGKTRVGKSVGSKTMLFAQSRFEIAEAERTDLVHSIVTAKHLNFFKAEPLFKFKPGVFDDGLLQKMDASCLKAFLNPAVSWLNIANQFRLFLVNMRSCLHCPAHSFCSVSLQFHFLPFTCHRKRMQRFGPGTLLLSSIKGQVVTPATTRTTHKSMRTSCRRPSTMVRLQSRTKSFST